MTKILLTLAGLALLLPAVATGQKPTPTPKPKATPTPQQVQRATVAAYVRMEKAQRSALLAQRRALAAQEARIAKARRAALPKGKQPLLIVARPPVTHAKPTPPPKPTPAPSSAPTTTKTTKFTGVITAVDLAKNTVTVKRESTERTFSFLTTVSLNFYSGEGNGLKSLTVGTTLDITSADGKTADVIVVHDQP